MSAWKILGPNGTPMVVANGEGHITRDLSGATSTQLEVIAKADQAWAQEVQKRVRSRAVSILALDDRVHGRQKPTPVTYETLRLMATRSEWVRAIIKKRKNQIAGVGWDITLKDTDDPSGAATKASRSIKKLLSRPSMHGSRPTSTSWRQFVQMFLGDLLEIDRACIEKERDGNGWIVAMYNVDGSTIRPNLDRMGGYHDDAYVQVVDGTVTARFGMEDLICTMDNPQVDVRYAGYGLSPLESLIVSITADLHAAKFNSDYFQRGAIPEGVLHLGADIAPEDVDAFRLYWANEIQGRPHSLPIIGGSDSPEFMQWRQANRDMQFMEYQQWLLQKMCAAFQMSPKELGDIDDVNRSTAEDATANENRAGLEPLLALLKDTFDLEIIGEHGQGLGDYLEFTWEQQGESAEEINAKFQPLVSEGAASMAEWREAHGMDPDGDPQATHGKEGLRMHLSGGQQQPLPSGKDADVLGAAAQQDREDEQQQMQMEQQAAQGDKDRAAAADGQQDGGEASPMPWRPANPDDEHVQQAMADHDDEHGIGPRNVGKTDRHPAMTRSTESLEDVLASATERLISGLAEVLGS